MVDCAFDWEKMFQSNEMGLVANDQINRKKMIFERN